MKMLLRHKTTGLYFQEPGSWVRHIEAASDFRSSQRAIDRIRSECMTEVEVIAIFPSGNHVDSVCYQVQPRSVRPRLQT
jgi:hypothetical protein